MEINGKVCHILGMGISISNVKVLVLLQVIYKCKNLSKIQLNSNQQEFDIKFNRLLLKYIWDRLPP